GPLSVTVFSERCPLTAKRSRCRLCGNGIVIILNVRRALNRAGCVQDFTRQKEVISRRGIGLRRIGRSRPGPSGERQSSLGRCPASGEGFLTNRVGRVVKVMPRNTMVGIGERYHAVA